ncbi:MAG: metallophosphoesterase [Oscillospiraceae bacterium]|nr:metallophosphoesterase [Oscillospiraceae bacterium]
MPIYAIADTHLSHFKDKPMDIFGSRWTKHTEQIAESWRATVTSADTVVLPGDISWAMNLDEALPDFRFLADLPGRKIISKGNHDYWWQTNGKITDFFREHGIVGIELLHNNAFVVEDYVLCGTRGWYSETTAPSDTDFAKLQTREVGRLELSLQQGRKLDKAREILVFLHFPPVYGSFVFRGLIDMMHKYGVTRCCYGHIHGKYNVPQVTEFEGIAMHNVAADFLKFVPYRIDKKCVQV